MVLTHLKYSSMAQTTSMTAIFSLLFLLETLTLSSGSSIHDLLKSQGLPGGLFPRNLRSYTLHEDGLLEVYMGEPCLAMFESPVRFDSVVRANLSYGGLIGVQGLTQEELFLWFPVEDIIVKDPSSGLILFNIGLAEKQLAFSLFEDPPLCNPQITIAGSHIQVLGRKEIMNAHQVQR